MNKFFQKHRTRFGLLTVILILVFAKPLRISFFASGVALILIGELIRLWASGYLIKLDQLICGGPYSIVRNPLYFGTFMSTIGACIAAESWQTGVVAALFLFVVYPPTIKAEEKELAEKFGDSFRNYCSRVHRFMPVIPSKENYAMTPFSGKAFTTNKEWMGLVAWIIVIVFLYLKLVNKI